MEAYQHVRRSHLDTLASMFFSVEIVVLIAIVLGPNLFCKNGCDKADFLSSQNLLAAILLQKKSIMQELAANILMRIPIVEILGECLLR